MSRLTEDDCKVIQSVVEKCIHVHKVVETIEDSDSSWVERGLKEGLIREATKQIIGIVAARDVMGNDEP